MPVIRRMRPTLCILLLGLMIPTSHADQTSCSWLQPIPVTGVESQDIPSEAIFDVASFAETDVLAHDLRDREFTPLTTAQATRLTNGHFRPQQGKRPFLVRAVYWQARGPHSASHRGGELTTSLSPGRPVGICHRSALIVNLSFSPTDVRFALWGGG